METFGMNVVVPPAGMVGGLALSLSAIRLCGPGVILVVAVARVRDVGVSGVGVATSAVLMSLPTDSPRATRVIVARLPGAIDSSSHLIGLRLEQEPLVLCTETISAGMEKASVTVGVTAVAGPWLVIVIVYFSSVPNGAWAWSTVLVRSRSASVTGAATGLTIALELSSSGCAIGSFADAVAVFCTVVPAAEGATLALSVTRAVPPAASVPRLADDGLPRGAAAALAGGRRDERQAGWERVGDRRSGRGARSAVGERQRVADRAAGGRRQVRSDLCQFEVDERLHVDRRACLVVGRVGVEVVTGYGREVRHRRPGDRVRGVGSDGHRRRSRRLGPCRGRT